MSNRLILVFFGGELALAICSLCFGWDYRSWRALSGLWLVLFYCISFFFRKATLKDDDFDDFWESSFRRRR